MFCSLADETALFVCTIVMCLRMSTNADGLYLSVTRVLQERGLYTCFADPWTAERDKRSAGDREVEIRDSWLFRSVKPIKPVVYGKFAPSTVDVL